MGQRLVVQIKDNDNLLATCYYHWGGYTPTALIVAKEILEAKLSLPKNITLVQQAVYLLRNTGATLNLLEYPLVYGRPFKFEHTNFTQTEINILTKLNIKESDFTIPEFDGQPFELTDEELKYCYKKDQSYNYKSIFENRMLSKMWKHLMELTGYSDGAENIFGAVTSAFNPPIKITQEEKIDLTRVFNKLFYDRNCGLIDTTLDGMNNSISWSEMDLIYDINSNTIDISQVFLSSESVEEYKKEYETTDVSLNIFPSSQMDYLRLAIFLDKEYHEDNVYLSGDLVLYSLV